MSAGTHINDAGTWRKLKNIYVNDAGTWRRVRYAYVNDNGTWRTVFAAQDEVSIVAAHSAIGGGTDGYSNASPAIGSISGATLGDGKVVTRITTELNGLSETLKISGFGADPGIGYLTSFEGINGVQTGASAAYSYSGGVATWTWGGFSGPYATAFTYTVYIIRA